MHTVINTLLPVFGIVLLGFLAARRGALHPQAVQGLSVFVFDFSVPCLLFRSLARAELSPDLPWRFLAAYYLGAGAVFLAGALASRLVFRRPFAEQVLSGFASSYGNTVLLGIPIVLTAYGEAAGIPLFLIIAFHSPILVTANTLLMEFARGRGGGRQTRRAIARATIANPIVMGVLLGAAFNVLSLPIPAAADRLLALLGQAAAPAALFATGASLAAYRLAGALAESSTWVALKLVVHPLLVFALCRLLAIDSLWTQVAVTVAALPAGVNAYLFAQRYDTGVRAATTTVFLSTLVSALTLSVLLWMFHAG